MTKAIDTYIKRQLQFWHKQREDLEGKKAAGGDEDKVLKPFLTISREYGCGGIEIANHVAKILNEEYKSRPDWAVYDRQILEKLSEDMGFSTELAETLTSDSRNQITEFFSYVFSNLPSSMQVYKKLAEIVRTLATNGHVIIMGRGGSIITQDMKCGLQVKIVAPLEWRISRISKLNNITNDDAKKQIEAKTKKRRSVFNEIIKYDIMNPYNYHLVINNEKYTGEEAARLIVETMVIKGLIRR